MKYLCIILEKYSTYINGLTVHLFLPILYSQYNIVYNNYKAIHKYKIITKKQIFIITVNLLAARYDNFGFSDRS